MAKVDIDGDGKADFSINIGQVVMLVSLVVSMAGSNPFILIYFKCHIYISTARYISTSVT